MIRFQPIAPMSPAKTTPIVSTSGSTTPVAIVAATTVPNTRKATKLKNAAQTTATRGDSTRVDTTVAIELAASWKPLTKSNAERDRDDDDDRERLHRVQACFRTMASTTSEMSSIVSSASSIASTTSFQYNVAVALNSTEYRRREGLAVDHVALGLQAVDRVEVRAEALHRLQAGPPAPTASSAICTSRSACSLQLGHRRPRHGRRSSSR